MISSAAVPVRSFYALRAPASVRALTWKDTRGLNGGNVYAAGVGYRFLRQKRASRLKLRSKLKITCIYAAQVIYCYGYDIA